MSKLVIVESPGKIKKIKQILGAGYEVAASVGHIMDLDPKVTLDDVSNDKYKLFYRIKSDRYDVVSKLKSLAGEADEVFIATDKDREGEVIALNIAQVLNLNKPKRIAFAEITKNEIMTAIKNPRDIDYNLVDAQQARRVLDIIVGYDVSPILWSTINAKSAGRVQSVVVRLIIEKENEIKEFFKKDSSSFFRFKGVFESKKNKQFNASLVKIKTVANATTKAVAKVASKTVSKTTKSKTAKDIKEENEEEDDGNKIVSVEGARKLMESLTKASFKVSSIITKPSQSNPSEPFTTSTMQQTASQKLKLNSKRCMQAAQHLYEAGYITYMRTDSINLSDDALDNIQKYVLEKYGADYHRLTKYKSKLANTQEAHEAIRPTHVEVEDVEKKDKIGNDEQRLYRLIWKRTVASQMAPAKFNITTYTIDISNNDSYNFVTQYTDTVFPGYLVVYNIQEADDGEDENKDNSKSLDLKEGDNVTNISIEAKQEYEKPPTRYNEASLLKLMDPKNMNIGRPSTYANILQVIQERQYVKTGSIDGVQKEQITIRYENKKISEEVGNITIGKETDKLIGTELGRITTELLVKHFPKILDYKFTSDMEILLDDISNGSKKWEVMVKEFYNYIHPIVMQMKTNLPALKPDRETRLLGTLNDEEIYAERGRYGPMIRRTHGKTNKYAAINPPLTIESITLEDALALFEFPKTLGKHNNKNVIVNKGRYGYYLTYGIHTITSSLQEQVANELDINGAIELINKKIITEIKDGATTFYVINGAYGPYIESHYGKETTTSKIPPTYKAEELDLIAIKDIIASAKPKASKTASKTISKTISKTASKIASNAIEINDDDMNDNRKPKPKKVIRKKKDEIVEKIPKKPVVKRTIKSTTKLSTKSSIKSDGESNSSNNSSTAAKAKIQSNQTNQTYMFD